MILPALSEDPNPPIVGRRELESRPPLQRPGVGGEMMFGARIAMSLAVKITVLDVDTDREAHPRFRGQVFAKGRGFGRARKAKEGGVALRKHVGRKLDL